VPDHRVAVCGASGFAGALCAYLVHRHPELELTLLTARTDAGARHDALYPRYRVPLAMEEFHADRVAERADAALVAYPHGAGAPAV
jgi:N-acetyl-gamma-glutamyl-phosphate reductase